jgi:hypothetical protein
MKAHLKTLLTFLLITIISSLVAQDLVKFEGTNRKVGFKDRTGKVVVAPKYDRVSHFYYGFASVEINGNAGFIDKTGKEITRLKYRNTGNLKFSQIGLAAVPIAINQRDELKWGLIDKTGKEIISFKYDHIEEYPIQELIEVCIGCKWSNGSYKGGTYGFLDKLGNEVIPLIYEQVGYLSEELVLVKKNNLWGYVDKTNNEVIPLKFDKAENFYLGKAKVTLGDRAFYIYKTGKEIE